MIKRENLIARSQPFLPTTTPIRQIFVCQTGPTPSTGPFWVRERIVCVTDDALYVLGMRRFSFTLTPKELIATLPREHHFSLRPVGMGATAGVWATIEMMGEGHWVHRMWHAEVTAADNTRMGGCVPQAAPQAQY